uniref:Proteasome subunit beta n=1 Tax=Clastoptera arizonana TaxID=38151 RepID=A0A1B6D368_9HEMI
MSSVILPPTVPPGFSFDNYRRNSKLVDKGFHAPTFTKTGTTIVGILFADGVILGADTRATEGNTIADKNCSKIHYLAKNIYCCGAGTAADADKTTELISSQLELHRLNTRREPRVVTANTLLKQMLFRYQGHVSAALVLGGVDVTGPHLYSIFPHGSSDHLPYVTMGSGSLAAMSILETGWTPNMEEEAAKALIRNAVAGGVFNDLGSGNNIDMCIIKRGSVEYIRPFEVTCQKGERQGSYKFKKGTTAILSTITIPLVVEEESIKRVDPDSMDLSS